MLLVAGLFLSGCARPPVLPLNVLPPEDPPAAEGPAPPLRIRIVPFEDRRPETGRLGVRTPLWGDVQVFELAEPEAGVLAAEVMAHVLRRHGWQAEVDNAATSAPVPDVVVNGEIREMTVEAKGSLLETTIFADARVVIEALNTADESRVRQTLTGVGSRGVFWFEPEDAEQLLTEILIDSFRKLTASTTVDGTQLRLQ